MGRTRAYVLAKELGLDNKELMEICDAVGLTGKSPLASLEDSEVDLIRSVLLVEENRANSNTIPEKFAEVIAKIDEHREARREAEARRVDRTIDFFQESVIRFFNEAGWMLVDIVTAETNSVYIRFSRTQDRILQRRRIRISDHYTNFASDLAASFVLDVAQIRSPNRPTHSEMIKVVDAVRVYGKGETRRFIGDDYELAIEYALAELGHGIEDAATEDDEPLTQRLNLSDLES